MQTTQTKLSKRMMVFCVIAALYAADAMYDWIAQATPPSDNLSMLFACVLFGIGQIFQLQDELRDAGRGR